MTEETFFGGLIILIVVIGIVVAMTSPRSRNGSLSDWTRSVKNFGKGRDQSRID